MEQQEILFRLNMLEQQIGQLQQQFQAVESGIVDLESLNLSLDDIPNSIGKEILAQVGKGIYSKAKITSDELVINVGDNNFVSKNVPDTKRLIQKQADKLKEIKKELENNIELTNNEFIELVKEYQDSEEKNN